MSKSRKQNRCISTFGGLLLCAFILLQGCANKPWGDPLGEDAGKEILPVIKEMVNRDSSCPPTLSADLALFLDTPSSTRSGKGFFELSTPFSFRFVSSNPFGQPIFLAAGNHESYQTINTMERIYRAGSLRSLALRNSIPPQLFKDLKAEWLLGRLREVSLEGSTFLQDTKNRGIWVAPPQPDTISIADIGPISEKILLNLEKKQLLARRVINSQGKTIASFQYGNFHSTGSCEQPQEIDIEGMKYGVTIRMRLKNMESSKQVESYRLPVPPGYIRQLQP